MRTSPGLWFALGGAVLFGVSGVVAADAFAAVDPVHVAQYRAVMAAVVLLAVAARRRVLDARGSVILVVVFGGLLTTVSISYYWAIERLGVGPGVTIQFLGPVLVLAWMRLVQHRRVPIAAWVAAGAAVVGTAGMNGGWEGSPDPLGVAAGAGAALSFAAYLLVGERLGRRLSGLTATAWGFAVSAVVWLVLVPPEVLDLDGGTWARLAWVGVLGTAVPFLLEMAALRTADPGRVGVVATAEPVVAAAVAWVVLGQALDPIQMIGGGFVVAGVATVQWFAHAATPDVPPAAV